MCEVILGAPHPKGPEPLQGLVFSAFPISHSITHEEVCFILFIAALDFDLFVDLILPYTDVCIALYTQCFPNVCGKKKPSQATRAGFQPTTLLVQTS